MCREFNIRETSGEAWLTFEQINNEATGGAGGRGSGYLRIEVGGYYDLTITSGTTTTDLGNANVVVKNYENLSITGSGVLNFSNANANGTYVIIKVKNNATISGVIDFTNTGATGASAVACTSGSSQNGSAGTSSYVS